MDCSLPGIFHGIFQARVLEWGAITFSAGSSVFSKSSLNIWKFTVHVLLKPGLEILGVTLLVREMSTIVQ